MKIYFVLILIIICQFSCGDRSVKSGVSDPFPPQFSDIRARILMPRCLMCHSLVESRKLLLEKWVNPSDALASPMFQAIDSGSMPPYDSKLLDEEIEAIRLWIDGGAAND